MKVRTLLLAPVLAASGLIVLLAAPAPAQTVVTIGTGQAHECFLYAKAGIQLRAGVAVCTQALARDVLTKKDRAGTYDNRGVMLDMLGETERAAADFHMAIDLYPE